LFDPFGFRAKRGRGGDGGHCIVAGNFMGENVFEQVRKACKTVAQMACHVRINHARIDEYAMSLPLDQIANPELDLTTHYLGHGSDTLAFLVTLDAINFGSGYFPHLRKRPGKSGYFTIAWSLTDFYREHGPLSAQQLARLSSDDCTRIFGQDPGNQPAGELMQLFATALNDLGKFLMERFEGSFVTLVESASGSAERLVESLTEMPFFDDVLPYSGILVPFYKRAQITSADLAIAFAGEGPGRFDDLDRLTIFADNLVPHVLRVDGILLYEEALAAQIDAGQLLASGSPEEVELRACALHAVELMAKALQRKGHDIPPMKLDYLLWNRGQQSYYKQIHPRHRTRSVFY